MADRTPRNPHRKRARPLDSSASSERSVSPTPGLLPPASPTPSRRTTGLGAAAEFASQERIDGNEIDDDDYDSPLEDEDAEGGGIDLFAPGMEEDYGNDPRLDRYDARHIDDYEHEELDPMQRQAAEADMLRRDVLEGRLPATFLEADDLEGEQVNGEFMPVRRRRNRNSRAQRGSRSRRYNDQKAFSDADDHENEHRQFEDAADLLVDSLHDLKGKSVSEWIQLEHPRNCVKSEFRNFLFGYVNLAGSSVYGTRIRTMAENSGESLEVSFQHLESSNAILAYLLSNAPSDVIPVFDEVAMEVVETSFPAYSRVRPAIHVRITDLPVVLSIRDLREVHLNSLVRISGVVTRRTGVFPQLKLVKFDCVRCGTVIGPIAQDATQEVKVRSCPSCMSKGPFSLNTEQTVYRNFQRMTLQETPGTVPPGRLPRHRDVIVLWDLVDSARPGDEIEVTGVYRNNFDFALNAKQGFPVFSTVIEANHISKRGDEFATLRQSAEDVEQIRALSRDPNIARRIVRSIAPSIYGHEQIKMALALALFGGVAKNVNNKHRVRGDINVLLLGDPGTAKSQFLKYAEQTCHRAVFATGQGASAVGLTAAVRKDPVSREWTLEGGALVLADRGVCLIDEFDKMNDSDRTSIHEAMEQQSISISKAGIVTSLHARCAIIAAANPIRGRYNPQVPFSQNVDLTEPILSRFDVLCVVRDRADPVRDEMLADFVLNSHVRSHALANIDANEDQGEETENGAANKTSAGGVSRAAAAASVLPMPQDVIPQDLLRKYIMYAREKVVPVLQEVDEDMLSRLYAELRRESLQTGSVPITVRHLESIIRMAESHARMHLRDYVRSDDIDAAIGVALDSFIGAQKYTVMRQLRRAFAKYVRRQADNTALVLHALNGLVRDASRLYQLSHAHAMPTRVCVPVEDLAACARDLNVHNLEPFFGSSEFRAHGFVLQSLAAAAAASGSAATATAGSTGRNSRADAAIPPSNTARRVIVKFL